MKNIKNSLANTKLHSQAFACLVFNKHNIYVDKKKIRQENLKIWFSDKQIPSKEKSYISQLTKGTASFGEKAARRLENDYNMGEMYLDQVDANSIGLDLTNVPVPRIDLMKKIAIMNDDEFRVIVKLHEATEAMGKTTEKDSNNKE